MVCTQNSSILGNNPPSLILSISCVPPVVHPFLSLSPPPFPHHLYPSLWLRISLLFFLLHSFVSLYMSSLCLPICASTYNASVSTHHLAGFDHPPPFQLSNPPTTTISLKSRPELSLIYVLQNFRLTRWIAPASWFKKNLNTKCIRKFDDIVMIRQKHQTKIYKRKQRRH